MNLITSEVGVSGKSKLVGFKEALLVVFGAVQLCAAFEVPLFTAYRF